jgi:DNA-directed RNA polymerase specialized sigma24 family protein
MVAGGKFIVDRPEGQRVFGSRRAALIEITRARGARNWTWDRYFRQGRYRSEMTRIVASQGVTLFDLFGMAAEVSKITTASGDVPVARTGLRGNLTSNRPSQLASGLGVDLVKRGHEVRKLLFAGFGGKIRSAGYDPDEVLQEVYKGILVRNAGKCPFDSKKASFGHYVTLICGCVMSNYHRKMQRQRKVEPIADEGDELVLDHASGGASGGMDELEASDFGTTLQSDAPWGGDSWESKVYPLLRAGYGRTEIADQLGLPKAAVTKLLSSIREQAREWIR